MQAMLESMLSTKVPFFTCLVRTVPSVHQKLTHSSSSSSTASVIRNIRPITTTSCCSKYFDRYADTVRQIDKSYDDNMMPKDNQPMSFGASGTSWFPTLKTHDQLIEGVRFMDLPIVHIKATRNNTIITAADGPTGLPIAIQTAGTVGFRNAKKGTNVAAQAAAIALAGDARRKGVKTVRVCLKGIGPGREPALKALQVSGMKIISITDTTDLVYCRRPKKARRL